jgi:hypothetical protein
LNLLTENFFWTATGHTAVLLSGRDEEKGFFQKDLSLEERLFWFRVFLEKDAGALQFFAREVAVHEEVPSTGKDWNDLANEMTVYIYNSYLTLSEDIRDRAEMRQVLNRRQRQPYKGKSGAHQCFLHINTLFRTGLLSATGRKYRRSDDPIMHGSVDRFVALAPDISRMEATISKSEIAAIMGKVFWGDLSDGKWTERDVLAEVGDLYARVSERGVSLCPLITLSDAVQIKQLGRGECPIPYQRFLSILRAEQSRDPKRVRFHVDRLGRPAFITLC